MQGGKGEKRRYAEDKPDCAYCYFRKKKDTRYDGFCQALKNIIRGNLTTTNTVVIAAIIIRKNGKNISLLSRSYGFSLDGYFQKICEEKVENINSNYGRRVAQWC